jgi:hypothetical protein
LSPNWRKTARKRHLNSYADQGRFGQHKTWSLPELIPNVVRRIGMEFPLPGDEKAGEAGNQMLLQVILASPKVKNRILQATVLGR